MSPLPDLDISRHLDDTPDQRLSHLEKQHPSKTSLQEGWIATSVEVQSSLPSERAMSLQAPDAAARPGHDRQWAHNGSEKSFHSFPSMSMSDGSMEHGMPSQKEQGSGVKKDLMALLNLMAVIPIVSFGVALYTLFTSLILLLLSPLRFCIPTRPPLTTQLHHHLLPPLNLHFKSAYSSRRCYPPPPPSTTAWPGTTTSTSPPQSRDPAITTTDTTTPTLPRLLTVLLLTPVLSLPTSISAFILAIFWMFSALTTDETADPERAAGRRTLDDGRWLAKRLRRWWLRWLGGELFDGHGKGRGSGRRDGARSSRR